MALYGKSSQNAVAAISRLAEVYAEGRKLSSGDIAKDRHLPKPIVAKGLTVLSQAGLIIGSPGPGGGYALARPPEEISLYDVSLPFERQDDRLRCPFGPDWCGQGDPCPLHAQLLELRQRDEEFMKGNKLSLFVKAEQQQPKTVSLMLG